MGLTITYIPMVTPPYDPVAEEAAALRAAILAALRGRPDAALRALIVAAVWHVLVVLERMFEDWKQGRLPALQPPPRAIAPRRTAGRHTPQASRARVAPARPRSVIRPVTSITAEATPRTLAPAHARPPIQAAPPPRIILVRHIARAPPNARSPAPTPAPAAPTHV